MNKELLVKDFKWFWEFTVLFLLMVVMIVATIGLMALLIYLSNINTFLSFFVPIASLIISLMILFFIRYRGNSK